MNNWCEQFGIGWSVKSFTHAFHVNLFVNEDRQHAFWQINLLNILYVCVCGFLKQGNVYAFIRDIHDLGYVFIYKNKKKPLLRALRNASAGRVIFSIFIVLYTCEFLCVHVFKLNRCDQAEQEGWTLAEAERVGLSVFRDKNRSRSRSRWRWRCQRAAQPARCTRPDTVGWGLHRQPDLQHIYILPYPLSKANSLVMLDTRRVCGDDEVWLEVVGRLEEPTEYWRDYLRNKLSL